MFEKFKRLVFLPVLISNLYSIYGVLFLNWSIADIFFWFWCEFVLTGLMMIILTCFWARAHKVTHPNLARLDPLPTAFSFLLILFFASLFTVLAYIGEWQSWNRFPEFLADKKIGLVATVVCYLFYFGNTLRKPDYGLAESKKVEGQFCRKAGVVLGIYAVLMFHYHWTGAQKLDLSPAYLKAMGMLLLTFKLIAELGFFDWIFKRGAKQA